VVSANAAVGRFHQRVVAERTSSPQAPRHEIDQDSLRATGPAGRCSDTSEEATSWSSDRRRNSAAAARGSGRPARVNGGDGFAIRT